jgi:ribonucleotide reductase beta subunit family protein with ferritin-like domain
MSKDLFNRDVPRGVTTTGVIHGLTSGIIDLNGIKYQWAYNLWSQMLKNTWFPTEVDLTRDVSQYKLMLQSEKFLYDRILAQLIFMDGLQTNNSTDNVNPWITAPEINMCIVRQGMEEALHCYVEGTEVLTSKGFVDFKDINESTLFANYYANGDILFSKASEIIVGDYSGAVVNLTGQNMDISVTPNHRVLFRNHEGISKVVFANDLQINYSDAFYTSGMAAAKGDDYLSPLERALLLIAVNGEAISTGFKMECFESKSVSKIISEAGLKFDQIDNVLIIESTDDGLLSWVDLSEKSFSWCRNFIMTYEHFRINTKVKKSIEDELKINNILQSVVSLAGMNPNAINNGFFESAKKYGYYEVGSGIKKSISEYTGKIYSVTVPSSFLIVRRNGKSCVSGNSQSYAVMVDTISTNTSEIYEMWRKDEHLFSKNEHILDTYSKYKEIVETDDEAKIYMLTANISLESIYFYSGFAGMYSLARAGKMNGSAQMIRFIQRDEATHVTLYTNTYKTIKKEFPNLFTKEVIANIRAMLKKAAEMEISWGKYITKDGVFGLSPQIIEMFVKYLTNTIADRMGLDPIYEGVQIGVKNNPIPWFDEFSKINDQKTNFFEGTVSSYSKGSLSLDF